MTLALSEDTRLFAGLVLSGAYSLKGKLAEPRDRKTFPSLAMEGKLHIAISCLSQWLWRYIIPRAYALVFRRRQNELFVSAQDPCNSRALLNWSHSIDPSTPILLNYSFNGSSSNLQFRRRKVKNTFTPTQLVPEAIQAPADHPTLAPVLAATKPFLSMSPTQPSPPPPSFTTQGTSFTHSRVQSQSPAVATPANAVIAKFLPCFPRIKNAKGNQMLHASRIECGDWTLLKERRRRVVRFEGGVMWWWLWYRSSFH